jgi:hypothetical protein
MRAPTVRVVRMARTHLKGILNAALLRTTCSAAESMDARIQRIERTIFGDNIHERVRNAILFHLGGPDLDPRAASAHTSS